MRILKRLYSVKSKGRYRTREVGSPQGVEAIEVKPGMTTDGTNSSI